MALTLLYIIAIIMGFICLIALGFFIYNKKRIREEPENETIIENYMTQYSGGHTDGIIDSIEFSENMVKIEFYPRDINYIKELKKDKNFVTKKYTIFYDKRQVIPLPNFSSHRNKLKAFPPSIEMLPEGLLNTNYGKKIAEIINENNKMKDESELLQERLRNLEKISEEVSGGKIFTSFVEKIKEQMKDLSENIKKEERIIEKDKK